LEFGTWKVGKLERWKVGKLKGWKVGRLESKKFLNLWEHEKVSIHFFLPLSLQEKTLDLTVEFGIWNLEFGAWNL